MVPFPARNGVVEDIPQRSHQQFAPQPPPLMDINIPSHNVAKPTFSPHVDSIPHQTPLITHPWRTKGSEDSIAPDSTNTVLPYLEACKPTMARTPLMYHFNFMNIARLLNKLKLIF